jgi:para-nitrobenzyl esterase
MGEREFVCNNKEPIAQTVAGKIRGFRYENIYTFHGIKYADAKRFQAPQPVKPWTGVKDAMSYGFVCPLMSQETPAAEQMVPHRYWPMDENCQYLNIWTQRLEADAKKPVMVWLHGGGFFAGSSIEQVAYDGVNLCRSEDVVVVSLNHRLNILGYLDLSPFGEKYKNSGNAGNADLVAALRWIHENIGQFGGDPENVTLFGQSGGGMKVWTLMQTPAADGLFQKGVIESGVMDGFLEQPQEANGKAIVEALLKELGLVQAEQLETVPYAELAAAYGKVAPAVTAAGKYVGGNPMANEFYLGDPRTVGFCAHAKTIPLMIGTVFGEFAFGPAVDGTALGEKQKKALIAGKYGKSSEKLIALFRAAYPEKDLTDLLSLDSLFRAPTKDFIEKKTSAGGAPIYAYLFGFNFPLDNGHPAWHCSEIPFVFHNTDKVPVCNVPGVSDKLERQLCGAWASFARDGVPSEKELPQWPACTVGQENTMVLDRVCAVKPNFDQKLIALHKKVVPPYDFGGADVQH